MSDQLTLNALKRAAKGRGPDAKAARQEILKRAAEGVRRPKRTPKNRSEADVQSAFFRLLAAELPDLAPFVFSVPNEHISKRETIRMKYQGMRTGIPDVVIGKPTHCGAPFSMIEFKAPYRRAKANPLAGTSQAQREKLALFASIGAETAVHYDEREALEWVRLRYA